ncbi:MAG: hypothetical protein ACLPXB_06730 [Thiobacillaceae bacterium]
MEEFLSAVLMHLFLPLVPLGLEFWFTGKLGASGLAMATAMYAIGIGNTTKFRPAFAVYLIMGFVFAAVYGYTVSQGTRGPSNATDAARYSLLFVFGSHLAERFRRHVFQKELFWGF